MGMPEMCAGLPEQYLSKGETKMAKFGLGLASWILGLTNEGKAQGIVDIIASFF